MKEDIVSANESLNKWCNTQGINYYEGIEALGRLFKYAVPRLQDRGHQVEILGFEHKGFRATVYKDGFTQDGAGNYEPCIEPICQKENEDPALALFWAIWEIIQ